MVKAFNVVGKAATASGIILIIMAGMSSDSNPLSFIMKLAFGGCAFLLAGALILKATGSDIFS